MSVRCCACIAEFRKLKPAIVHTHMAKAGMVGRGAAFLYNLTRGSAPRPEGRAHLSRPRARGIFQRDDDGCSSSSSACWRRSAIASSRSRPQSERSCSTPIASGANINTVSSPLGFDLSPFAAIDDAARVDARRALGLPEGVPVITTVGRLTAIKQHRLFLDTIKLVLVKHPNAARGDRRRRRAVERPERLRRGARNRRPRQDDGMAPRPGDDLRRHRRVPVDVPQ